MTLIKKAPPLSDPNRDCNMKHTTPNEIMHETLTRKHKKLKAAPNKKFMSYREGQYEQIFKKNRSD